MHLLSQDFPKLFHASFPKSDFLCLSFDESRIQVCGTHQRAIAFLFLGIGIIEV
jgi:ABC-type Mn2+/Zn2+ transport system permease subunit